MGTLVKGLHHACIKASAGNEFYHAVQFYRDILNMPVVRTWGEGKTAGIMFDTGCGIIEIFADAECDLPQGAIRHIGLLTDDVDACIAAVREAGYQVTMEPRDFTLPSDPAYPLRIAFAIGPVGEEIEFLQEK